MFALYFLIFTGIWAEGRPGRSASFFGPGAGGGQSVTLFFGHVEKDQANDGQEQQQKQGEQYQQGGPPSGV